MQEISPQETSKMSGVTEHAKADTRAGLGNGFDHEQLMWLREQANEMAWCFPDLFTYLQARDRLIRHTLVRIPEPGDPEAYIGIDQLERLLNDLRDLPPGIADFVRV